MRLDPPPSPVRPVAVGTGCERVDRASRPVPALSPNSTAAALPPTATTTAAGPTAAATPAYARLHPLAISLPSPHGARLPRRGGCISVAHGETRWYVVIRSLEVGVFNGW